MSNEPTNPEATTTDAPTESVQTEGTVGSPTDEAPAEIVELPDALTVCQEQLKKVTANYRAVSKAYAQKESEMSAYRKRMAAKAKIQGDQRAAQAVEKFFDPVQNLKRALTTEGADPATVLSGVGMVLGQFDSAMTALGLAEVPGVGSRFDPLHHEALAIVPVEDAALDGLVTSVYKSGYWVGSRVLTPAQVVVGKFTAVTAEE